MEYLLKLLSGFDTVASVTVLGVILILIIWCLGVMLKHHKDIMNALNMWFKRKREKEELLKMVYENKKAIEEYAQNRIRDREQSFEIQDQLTEAIDNLSKKIDDMDSRQSKKMDSMAERQEELERKNDQRNRAELKEKISRLYSHFHEKKEWNSMEQEVMTELIKEYENAGGQNSFVHSTVQPEMYTWKITNENM